MIAVSTITGSLYTDDGFEPYVMVRNDRFEILRIINRMVYIKFGDKTLLVHELELQNKYRIDN